MDACEGYECRLLYTQDIYAAASPAEREFLPKRFNSPNKHSVSQLK